MSLADSLAATSLVAGEGALLPESNESLRQLLDRYRLGSKSEREKGGYFERLVAEWLRIAPTQRDQFLRVLTFGEWAEERREDRRDVGIDLCAQLAEDPATWCAIQCKFYAKDYRIQRADIDSFFTASGKRPFARRIIVDTTDAPWSEHAENALQEQIVPTTRVGLTDLEESGIDWSAFVKDGVVRLEPKKLLRPHQSDALEAVAEGLEAADRGKVIMACGTGKTFTSLKIAEGMAGRGGRVLYLVPSLALMSQTVREWSIDSETPLRSFAVCSDTQVGVRKARDDLADIDVHDLELPATTRAPLLAAKANSPDLNRMTVVFSTYQSIQVISEAQMKFGLPEFDLIVCDEAHRTTGVTLAGEDESNFVRVHDQAYIAGKKRIYMTATPRIYGEGVRSAADEAGAEICSMDDPEKFGETLFTRNFSWAVQNDLLTDYKVVVLAVDESAVSASVQGRLSDENSELVLDDATKIIGCYRALTKADLASDVAGDQSVMHRALAFTRDIKSSKLFASEFANVADEWRAAFEAENPNAGLPELRCQVQHVDGTFNATARGQRLNWLKEATGDPDLCRILSNARCLSEGVDVPALDAIIFLHPRKSQIDVVQSVGRVMRKAEGKRLGYVILPVGVPAGVPPEEALDNNEKYRVVWQILNALRAHDDRLDATINKIDLGVDPGDRIEVVAVTNTLPQRSKPIHPSLDVGAGGGAGDIEPDDILPPRETGGGQLAFQFDDFARAILSRIVKRCGTRAYWDDWAKDVARIAEIHVTRLTVAVKKAESREKAAFDRFLAEIRDDLNDTITTEDAVEMLAQHMITRPVFEALFEGYSFASQNPVSVALESVLDVLDHQHLEKETQSLERFYASVRMRAADIDDAAAKQKIVKDLYEKFFKTAFPRTAARLGIVYTPIEVVDFIIKSVDEVLRDEFGLTLGSEGVHIIDPFAGTGTFITRLLQSGLIDPTELARKYADEIHANEIALLAYYVAAINIEATYHALSQAEYAPFPGICLTDTFQLYEKDDLISGLMSDNSSRRVAQKGLPLKVIIGNPPYSGGQKSENDNAANIEYPHLDQRIRETYAAHSGAKLSKAIYDPYIRAVRWGSDRLTESGGGVMALVTNAGWLEANTADGLRKCLVDDFSSIHLFHLRGNARTQGEQRRREKDNVFGQGTRTPVVIAVFVNNPDAKERGLIRFHDIGDYLSRDQKLDIVRRFGGLSGIEEAQGWRTIIPNESGDWLGQRDESFNEFLAIADKDSVEGVKLFDNFSQGILTSRDAWCYNSSRDALNENVRRMLDTYESERQRYLATSRPVFERAKQRDRFVDDFVTGDSTRISWSGNLKFALGQEKQISFHPDGAVQSLYRPFHPQWLYLDRQLNERVYQVPRLFPDGGAENLVIAASGKGASAFSCMMTHRVPCFDLVSKGQSFPLYLYGSSQASDDEGGEADAAPDVSAHVRDDAITEAGLQAFRVAYDDPRLSREDVFYYVYGLFHSPDYRERFSDNLSKQLPRIPFVKGVEAFRAFSDAGRQLGRLHVGFDNVEPYPVTIKEGDFRLANIEDPVSYFRVEKMRFGGKRGADKTTIIYNPRITLTDIPLHAYDYVVNGKSAIDWVVERQCVKTDPASGIVNDANRYANETMGDPAYPLKLLQRVITISLETLDIVESLPPLGDLSTAQ
jgi:predicted helicase